MPEGNARKFYRLTVPKARTRAHNTHKTLLSNIIRSQCQTRMCIHVCHFATHVLTHTFYIDGSIAVINILYSSLLGIFG